LTNIAKGSIITVNVSGDVPNSIISNIAINGTPTASFSTAGSSGACNMSSSAPDQIYLMQGDFIGLGTYSVSRYNVFTGKVLFGMTNAAPWVLLSSACSAGTANSDRVSRIPDDIECFNLEFTTNRDAYYYLNSALHNGSQRQLLGSIMNTVNWTQPSNTACLDVPEDFSGAVGTSAGKQFTFIVGNAPGYWVGDFNTDWFNCRNWESFTVPDPTVDVTIPIANIPSGAINNARVDVVMFATTAAKYSNVAQCKNLTVSGRSLIVEGNINNKLVSFGNFIFPVGGTGTFDMDDGNNASPDGQFYLIGNWTNQLSETNFLEGNSTVYLLGSGTQIITTSLVDKNENFYNVSLDNPAGYTIDGDVTVKGNMNMINGVVTAVMNITDEVVFTDNATVTNLSATSFVSGKVRKIGNDAFVFPTGKPGHWARIAIAAPSSTTSSFQAEYFPVGFGIYTVNPPLNHVSTVEYWNLFSVGTASNVNDVTLYWEDAIFSGIYGGPLTPNLRVAYYMPVWDDKGAAGLFTSGNTGHLASSSAPISAFGQFTFGSLIIDIPLPVELIRFTAKAVDNKKAELTWMTASEINNDYFTVLRSDDGLNFEPIGRVGGNGTTTSVSKYYFTDEKPFKGNSYYKLLQTDFNNKTTESEIRSVNIFAEGNFGISNVISFENTLSFQLFNHDKLKNVSVELYDFTGRIIYKAADYSNDNQKLFKISTTNFNHAVYILKITGDAGNALVKVIL
ncbi:MAG: T9SS type A sorting domain-containing protein, partial [Bacteroidota bacterium]